MRVQRHSGFGWMELITGVLLIVLAIITFANPRFALTGLVMIYGIAAVIMGISDIVLYVRMERYTGFGPTVSLITGILSVMCGMMLLIYPGTGGKPPGFPEYSATFFRILIIEFATFFLPHHTISATFLQKGILRLKIICIPNGTFI